MEIKDNRLGYANAPERTGEKNDGGNWTPFVRFGGKGGEYFGILFGNFILSILTLGVYSFWGKAKARRYIWSRTSIMGEPLEYTGTGKELFISFLIVIPPFLVFAFFLSFLAQTQPFLAFIVYPAFLFLWEFASYRALRYRLTRTRWRGIRGNMSGSALSYAWKACGYWLAIICSLGLLMPWGSARMTTLKLNEVWFGNRKAAFNGPAKELMKPFFVCYASGVIAMAVLFGAVCAILYATGNFGVPGASADPLVSLAPIGLMLLYFLAVTLIMSIYQAAHFRWLCRHFAYGQIRLRSLLAGMQVFRVMLGNLLQVACTLGFGYAWAYVRGLRLVCNSVEYQGDPQLVELLQDSQKAPTRGEGLLEALDVDIAL